MTVISIFNVISKVKFKVRGWNTGYRPEITSARIPKWPQATVSLPGQLAMSFDLAFGLQGQIQGQKDRVPDIVPELRQQVCQIRPK